MFFNQYSEPLPNDFRDLKLYYLRRDLPAAIATTKEANEKVLFPNIITFHWLN